MQITTNTEPAPTIHYTATEDTITVTWDDAEELLGHAHAGTPEDDAALTRALATSGAPTWVAHASGFLDSEGWHLTRPAIEVIHDGPTGPVVDYWDHSAEEVAEAVGHRWTPDYSSQVTLATGQYRAPLVEAKVELFTYTLSDGHSTLEIQAADFDDAAEQAEEWVRDGDWDASDGPTWVDVRILNEDGDYEGEVEVQIDQPEPDCTHEDGHDWQDHIGARGYGGGVIYTDRCEHCGLLRTTNTWATRPDNGTEGHEVVTYCADDSLDDGDA